MKDYSNISSLIVSITFMKDYSNISSPNSFYYFSPIVSKDYSNIPSPNSFYYFYKRLF